MSFCLFVAIPPCVCTMNDLFKRWKKSGVDAHEIPFKPARRTDLYFSFLHAAISHQHRFLLLVGFVSTTASPFFLFSVWWIVTDAYEVACTFTRRQSILYHTTRRLTTISNWRGSYCRLAQAGCFLILDSKSCGTNDCIDIASITWSNVCVGRPCHSTWAIYLFIFFFGFMFWCFLAFNDDGTLTASLGPSLAGYCVFFLFRLFFFCCCSTKSSILGKRVGGREPFVACQHGFLSSI